MTRDPLFGRPWAYTRNPQMPIDTATFHADPATDLSDASPNSGTISGVTGLQGPMPHPGQIVDYEIDPELRQQQEWAARSIRPAVPSISEFGHLYDSLRTQQAWRHMVDIVFTGSVTPSTSAPTPIALTTNQVIGNVNLRLGQYPLGVQAHLCIRLFSFASRLTTATGTLLWTWFDPNQLAYPLGVFPAGSGSGALSDDFLSPTPITDQGNTNWGQLSVSMGGGGTPGVIDWQLAFSFAYLHPVNLGQGYSTLDMREHNLRQGRNMFESANAEAHSAKTPTGPAHKKAGA